MHARVLSPVAALALAAIAGAALAQPSLPNGASSLRETYGSWQIGCQMLPPPKDAPEGAETAGKSDRPDSGGMACVLAQVQREETRSLLVFSAELRLPDPASDAVAATFVLPFGIAVTQPIALKAGDKALKRLSVATCLPVGCIVPAAALQPEAIAALSAGKPLTLAAHDTDGRTVAFELKPEGFSEGLKRLRAIEAGGM